MTPQPPFLLLKAVDAFQGLAAEDLRTLYAAAHVVSLATGEKLADAHTPVDSLNVVMSGRLIATAGEAWSSEDQTAKAVFGPGHAVDTPRFFAFQTHPWQVMAARPSSVLRLSREDFREAMTAMPHLWESLLAGIVKGSGMPAQPAKPKPAARTVAVCPGAGGDVPREFVRALADALEPLGTCQILSAAGLGQNMPGGIAIDDPEVTHELAESERLNDVVLYIADRTLTPWTRRCIDRADEVLIVGVDDGDPTGNRIPATEVERCGLAMAGTRGARLALVTGRLSGRLQGGAERWLSARPVQAHHFVALGDRGSFERLARFVMGRANAVTLTGGGLCGAAHLGVIAALADYGVEVDAIGGTGAGAAVGALLACGRRVEDIDALARTIFTQRGVLTGARRQAALLGGRFGLYGHARYDRLIDRHIPHGTAADLHLPFCGFAANLSRAGIWKHDRDSVQAIVRTNWTPPGVFAPFITGDGDMLIDGSGVAPPPVERLRSLGVGRCFAVQPLPGPLGRAPAAYRDLRRIMGGGLAGRKSQRPALPTVADITLRAQMPRWFAG
ncbi:MAG: cyclic nucleotide-binding and patatin-like phospholipase domain-containing protein, partial [Dichotomicrobium sp.]